MRPAVTERVHRILKKMKKFKAGSAFDSMPPISQQDTARLGDSQGEYASNASEIGKVWVFDKGICWIDRDKNCQTILYVEISEISAPDGKDGNNLQLRTQKEEKLIIPFDNEQARFSDAMEWLRFLQRVSDDAKDDSI